MVHSRPQTPQKESVAKTETFLSIILSLVCKYAMVTSPMHFSNRKSVDENILGHPFSHLLSI